MVKRSSSCIRQEQHARATRALPPVVLPAGSEEAHTQAYSNGTLAAGTHVRIPLIVLPVTVLAACADVQRRLEGAFGRLLRVVPGAVGH